MKSAEVCKTAIGERLRLTRKAFGLRATHLCELLGLNAPTYSQWERGRRYPSLDAMAALCDRFDLTMDWIYRGRLESLRPELRALLQSTIRKDPQERVSKAVTPNVELAALFEGAPVGAVWTTDEHHRFTSHAYPIDAVFPVDRMFGRTRWELAGENPTSPGWRSLYEAMEAHEEFHDFHYEVAGRDGRLFRVKLSGKPVFHRDGRFAGYRGTGMVIGVEEGGLAHRQTAQQDRSSQPSAASPSRQGISPAREPSPRRKRSER